MFVCVLIVWKNITIWLLSEGLLIMSSVAVIIPTADRPELLKRAILSVLDQSHAADQIIIVDNGMREVEIDVADDRIMLVRTAPRIGPGRSRNVGVAHARTEYVAFLDDDDIWDSKYLEKSMEVVEKKGAKVVVGKLQRLALDGSMPRDYKLFPSDALAQRAIYHRNPGFGGQNILLDKGLFEELGGFDEKMPASVDRDLAARILQSAESIYVQSCSIAILCDHPGARVRESQVRGNRLFILKHWRFMTPIEFFLAVRMYLKRLVKSRYQRIV